MVNRAARGTARTSAPVAGEQRAAAGSPLAYTQPTNDMLDALPRCPTKQRAAVTLRYWADWTDEQIADALGCAPATVRVLLHRGLAALKKEIDRMNDEQIIERLRTALDEVPAGDPSRRRSPSPRRGHHPTGSAIAAATVLVLGALAALAVRRGHDAPASRHGAPNDTVPSNDTVQSNDTLTPAGQGPGTRCRTPISCPATARAAVLPAASGPRPPADTGVG